MRKLLALLLLLLPLAAQAQTTITGPITFSTGLTVTGATVTATAGGAGINELTGDVTAGPGVGSQAATLVTSNSYTWSGTQTFGPVIGSIGNSGAVVSGTTYTFAAADCGKTVVFTSGSAVTATIPASIVPATTVCAFAVLQAGTAKVSVNGSAVAAATLISENSFTGTSGTAGSMIGLTLVIVAAATNAYLTGSGS